MHEGILIEHPAKSNRFTPRRIYVMGEEEVIKFIIEEAIYVHKKLGPGLLENVYKTCLAYRLRKRGLFVENEKPVTDLYL